MKTFLSSEQVQSLLEARYATKAFNGEAVPEDVKEVLLESLRLSPSSYGLQPWKFVVVDDAETKAKLRPHSWNQQQVTQCGSLIVLCRRTDIDMDLVDKFIQKVADENGTGVETFEMYKQMIVKAVEGQDEAQLAEWASKQVYIALGFLMSACAMMGVDSCPMEGFSPEAYNEILGLEEKNLHAVLVCPVGYHSEEDTNAKRPKVRFGADEVIVRM